MRKMSHEMLEKAMHAKSADELKAMMTMNATPLSDSELDTITGGAGGSSGGGKIRRGTDVWFIHKKKDGSLMYDTGTVFMAYDDDYYGVRACTVMMSKQTLDRDHFPVTVLDSEIYLYSNEL